MTALRRLTRTMAAVAVAGTATLAAATPAFAATSYTSTATAQALDTTLAGGTLLATTPYQTSYDGTTTTTTGSEAPALGVLSGQSTVTAGVLAQSAVANTDGTSSACAGLLGAGGTVTIGSNGQCKSTVPKAGTGGVTLNLGGGLTLQADALTESCTAASNGKTTAQANLVGATVDLLGAPVVTLPKTTTTPNDGINVQGLLTLTLNNQTTSAGKVTASALHVAALGSTAVIDLGEVTCGANTALDAAPAIATTAVPYAAGAVALAALVAVPVYRRRRTARS